MATRVTPATGTDRQRIATAAAGKFLASEAHTTSDHGRAWMGGTRPLTGAVYLGTVATEAAMLALFASGAKARGCFEGDDCYRSDTLSWWKCIANNGKLIGEWQEMSASVGTVAAADVTYDPTASGLTATDVQAAIDEIQAEIDALPSGSGTVTSVALTAPSIISVAGSPITGSGTFALTLATQNANKAFLGPATGSAAAPTFRSLVSADFPTLLAAFSNLTNAAGKLTNDGSGGLSWVAGGSGDFVGPASATDNAIVRFDTTTGKLGKNSTLLYIDSSSGILTLNKTATEIQFPSDVSSFNSNTLSFRATTANTGTQINLLPSGSATDVCFLIHGDSNPDASGHNAFGFGGGFAGAVGGSWNFGSFNQASAASASRPISFLVSNSSDGRIETLRLKNTGQVYLPYSKPEIQFEIGANNINSLSFRASTANTGTFINVLPSGSATETSVLLYGGNDPDATGVNILGFGGGFAGAVAGSWNFGSFNRASVSSNSRPFSFVVSNSTAGRFEAMNIANTGKLTVSGSIKSGAPSGGTAAEWKLGSQGTGIGLALVATQYIELDIGGTLYKLALVS